MTTPSKAAVYGALVGETVVDHLGKLLHWNPATQELDTMLGDLITDLLHWGERQGIINDNLIEEPWTTADDIIGAALRHFEAERAGGDDLARDNHYDRATGALLLARQYQDRGDSIITGGERGVHDVSQQLANMFKIDDPTIELWCFTHDRLAPNGVCPDMGYRCAIRQNPHAPRDT